MDLAQPTQESNVTVIDLGLESYNLTLKNQEKLLERRVNDEIGDTLLLVQHTPVYTGGATVDSPLEHFKDKNVLDVIKFVKVNRGGLVTYHGPGQLVAYPIFKLPLNGIAKLIDFMETAVIEVIREYGINGYSRKDEEGNKRGVWVDVNGIQKKICSIGLGTRTDQEEIVTMHGLALNVNTNLIYFSYIKPCGYDYDVMTSMHDVLKQHINFEAVKTKVGEKMQQWKQH
ncbi:MAG: lipoyl(octanoyl) transferase LipB [Nanoarchaeota archaeon]